MDKIILRKIHRAKWLYDRCKSIDEMLECLGQEITQLEELQELGVELEDISEDDYTRFIAKVDEDSTEHQQLLDLGLMVEEYDEVE